MRSNTPCLDFADSDSRQNAWHWPLQSWKSSVPVLDEPTEAVLAIGEHMVHNRRVNEPRIHGMLTDRGLVACNVRREGAT